MKKGAHGEGSRGPGVAGVAPTAIDLPVKGDFEVTALPEPMTRRRWVAMNEAGNARIGEYHHRAKLTDAQVDAIRDQYEAYPRGHKLHLGYKKLAQIWKVPVRTIRALVNYERRNQWAGSWRKV